ncbi:hypothetical protein [Neisseria sp. HMSC064E01]|nr:hypothetical protein [Neisseria sp. HMSC064E01]
MQKQDADMIQRSSETWHSIFRRPLVIFEKPTPPPNATKHGQ